MPSSLQVFGYTDKPLWTIVDVPIFMLMGILGGIMGAAWCALQKRITMLRMRLNLSLRGQMFEAVALCALNTTLFYLAAMSLGKCESIPQPTSATGQYIDEFNGNWQRVGDRPFCDFDCRNTLWRCVRGRTNQCIAIETVSPLTLPLCVFLAFSFSRLVLICRTRPLAHSSAIPLNLNTTTWRRCALTLWKT
jgi:H+/Cl- antiporter ClcA